MKFPKNFRPLTVSEQATSFAGYRLPMEEKFVLKKECEKVAQELIDNGDVTGMTQLSLAQEIFAHAYAYYAADLLIEAGIDSKIVDYIHEHSEVVDIDDGGDSVDRQVAYALIWAMTEPIIQ